MYLVWQGSEVATKKKRGSWRCFCGERIDDLHFMRVHLADAHNIVSTVLRQDDENYDGQKLPER